MKLDRVNYGLSGFWSRRITDEHRLVYTIKEKRLHIIQCRFHDH
ncbi:MAG: hypothetical protein E6Q24_05705 [Chitinophagaceae bacterium]|nr:MAG: hypothetical protein E6Q24_05705 [Chitinophagaceae bacterium]